jgi:hypothetical protein
VRRHDVDVFSLVAGLLFVGVALLWGFADRPADLLDSWPVPVLLIGVGAAGLAASLLRRRHD